MKTTKTTATITLLIAAALAMAACTPTAPTDPTTSPTASPAATSTPTPTPGSIPTQEPVPVPTSQQEAITSATQTIDNYLAATFKVDADPQLGAEYLAGFLVQGGPEQKVIADTVAKNLEAGWSKSGTPSKWTTNDAMSYASQSTNAATGEKFDLGAVVVYGCLDNSGWTLEGPGAPEVPKGSFPRQFTLIYEQTAQIWLVQESVSLTGQEGAPTC